MQLLLEILFHVYELEIIELIVINWSFIRPCIFGYLDLIRKLLLSLLE